MSIIRSLNRIHASETKCVKNCGMPKHLRRMNAEKLARLQAQVRIGGKGTPRRKKKTVHKAPFDDKKLQATLKKHGVQPIPGIEEVNMFRSDGKIIHFKNPKVQANVNSHIFAVAGNGELKEMGDLLPGIIPQLGQSFLSNLKNIAASIQKGKGGANNNSLDIPDLVDAAAKVVDDDDAIPELVDNFEEASKRESNN